MVSSFESARRRRSGQPPLGRAERIFTATEGNNVPVDFDMPPSGIKDVDKALFNLFDVVLNLQVSTRNETKRVPVVFAGGERFALTKSGRPIRDKSGAVIAPIISIHRSGVKLGAEPQLAFGTDTGDIAIKRRLDASDRSYQQLVNRHGIRNQDNVTSQRNVLSPLGRVASRRPRGETELGPNLTNEIGDNIFEVITIPTPTFMTLQYDITLWTSYIGEMNQLLETVCACSEVRIDTDRGYWYVMYLDTDVTTDDSFADYTTNKRYVRSKFSAHVPTYVLATRNPGDPSPFRSFLSAPQFDFTVVDGAVNAESLAVQMPMLDPSDKAFTLSAVDDVQVDGRVNTSGDRYPSYVRSYVQNPFASSQVHGNPRYSRVIYRSRKGERVGRIADAEELE
jgi:hypothetical protein